MKNDHVGRQAAQIHDDLRLFATAALHRLQKLPRLVRSFFADPHLAYIAD